MFDRVVEIIANQLQMDVDMIDGSCKVMEDLGADSVDVVELVMAMEEEFDVGEVQEDELTGMKTVGDAVRYLSKKFNG